MFQVPTIQPLKRFLHDLIISFALFYLLNYAQQLFAETIMYRVDYSRKNILKKCFQERNQLLNNTLTTCVRSKQLLLLHLPLLIFFKFSNLLQKIAR